jgi:hypothetical protein
VVDCIWNVVAHEQKKSYYVFAAKRTSPFKSAGGRQFSRLLAAEVCASAVVILDTTCSKIVWRVLATHCIRQFPTSLPSLRHLVPSYFKCNVQLPTPNTTNVYPKHKSNTKTLTLYTSQHLIFVSHISISLLCNLEIVCLSSSQYPTCVNLTDSWYHLLSLFQAKAVVYPGILFGWVGWWVQQTQLTTKDRENGDLGAVAPYSRVLEAAVT